MTSVVLITGASSGLGEGMAMAFAARGYSLALCARRLEQLEQVQQSIKQAHPSADVRIQSLDVNDHDAVFRVFEAFSEQFGRRDGLSRNGCRH